MKMIYAIMFLIFCWNAVAQVGVQNKWPKVRSFEKTLEFIDHQKQREKVIIYSAVGKPLYQLDCCLNAFDFADDDFDYSGIFECRLTSVAKYDGYTTLLTEEKKQTRDWQSRGRFLLDEISGKCSDYPDYGTKRTFKLRGMDLELKVKNFETELKNKSDDLNRIKKLTLEITVSSDPEALTEIAEPSKYLEPLFRDPKDPNHLIRNCDKILLR